jgi:hypothetical protein
MQENDQVDLRLPVELQSIGVIRKSDRSDAQIESVIFVIPR